jgi:hypothetical protein
MSDNRRWPSPASAELNTMIEHPQGRSYKIRDRRIRVER